MRIICMSSQYLYNFHSSILNIQLFPLSTPFQIPNLLFYNYCFTHKQIQTQTSYWSNMMFLIYAHIHCWPLWIRQPITVPSLEKTDLSLPSRQWIHVVHLGVGSFEISTILIGMSTAVLIGQVLFRQWYCSDFTSTVS